LRTFVAQTVTIGEQKVCPESLQFSATPTPQVENPSDSSTPTPQPCLTQLHCSFSFNENIGYNYLNKTILTPCTDDVKGSSPVEQTKS